MLKKHPLAIFLFICAVLFLAQDVVFTLNARSQGAVIGMKLNGKNVGGLSTQALLGRITQETAAPLLFEYAGKIYSVTAEKIGAEVDSSAIMKALLDAGHQGSLVAKIVDQDKALLGLSDISMRGAIPKPSLDAFIAGLDAQIGHDPLPPTPDFSGTTAQVSVAQDGVNVDKEIVAERIVANVFRPPHSPLPVPILVNHTVYIDQDKELAQSVSQAETLTKKALSIKSGKDILTFTPAELKAMLTVVSRPDVHNPTFSHIFLRLDEKKLNKKLGDFAGQVEAHTQAEFDDHDARVAIYSQFFSNKRALLEVPTGNGVGLRTESLAASEPTSVGIFSGDNARLQLASVASLVKPIVVKPQAQKFVYLTFDDGPNALYHPLILDILKKYNVKATFFLVGENAQKYSDVTERTLTEGHVIGNHSLTHAFLPDLTTTEVSNEIDKTSVILTSITKQKPTLFRPPYGGVNATVRKDSKDSKLKLTLWDVDPRDWSEPGTDELINRILTHVHSGSDILLHSNHLTTVDALPKIIEHLQAAGYTFKTL